MSPIALRGAESDEAINGFDLDVTLLEVADAVGQISATDDGCGSTCGACVSNAA